MGKKKKSQQTGQTSENPQMDQLMLQKLMEQKSNELSLLNMEATKEQIKQINSKFDQLNSFQERVEKSQTLSKQDKQKIQEKLLQQVADLNLQFEQQLFMIKKISSQKKNEIKTLQFENSKSVQATDNLKQTCQELEKNISFAKQQISKMQEEELNKRNELQENFQKSIGDIEQKMEDQKKEGEEVKKLSEEMKVELEEKIKKFDEREKEFKEQVEGRDGSVKEKTEEFLEKIKSIEVEAKEAMQLREKLHVLSRNETEKKLKIALYQKKFDEYNDTLDKTSQMLIKFKQELQKMALKADTSNKENQQYKENEKRGDKNVVDLMKKMDEAKQVIQDIKGQKDEYKERILKIQEQTKKLENK